MLKNKSYFLIILVFLFLMFGYGLIYLFILRFERGDIYPAYSSYSTDPIGSKIYYEALDNMGGVTVSRNLKDFGKIRDIDLKTMFILGEKHGQLATTSLEAVKQLETMLRDGLNLVITVFPVSVKTSFISQKEHERIDKKDSGQSGTQGKEDIRKTLSEGTGLRSTSLPERWGFEYDFYPVLSEGVEANLVPETREQLPESVLWHSGLVFKNIDDPWSVIYARGPHPVMIERDYGKGKLIIASDSYFHSNEALQFKRSPELLAWLVGSRNQVIFDETHLGLQEQPGIGSLARKYRLHGLLLALLVLGVLYVWKNSYSLLPPREGDITGRNRVQDSGKDYASGFINLLRRNISRRNLLRVCFDQWKKSVQRSRQDLHGKIERIKKIVGAPVRGTETEQDIVNRYKQITRILEKRR